MDKPIDWSLYQGPTRNTEFNYVYAAWVADGETDLPRCEDCDCDLTGKDVHETNIGWYCLECYEKSDDFKYAELDRSISEQEFIDSRTCPNWDRDREDFHSDG